MAETRSAVRDDLDSFNSLVWPNCSQGLANDFKAPKDGETVSQIPRAVAPIQDAI